MPELVLVVDDSPTTRKFVAFSLRLLGCRVIEAMDGQDALDQLERNPDTALIFTDLNMPNMDGLSLLRTVKGSVAHAHIPVLVLSSEQDDPVRQESLAAGADDYLVKPFSSEDVQRAAERFLGPLHRTGT
ncbi:MAG TPA: response regulator [Candidatus Saccharimonadales bacterium]|nr:response regulator [Candidatus Saccharimonadales bacterium]